MLLRTIFGLDYMRSSPTSGSVGVGGGTKMNSLFSQGWWVLTLTTLPVTGMAWPLARVLRKASAVTLGRAMLVLHWL